MPESRPLPCTSTSQKAADITLSSDSKSEGASTSSPHLKPFTEWAGTPGSPQSSVSPELSLKQK